MKALIISADITVMDIFNKLSRELEFDVNFEYFSDSQTYNWKFDLIILDDLFFFDIDYKIKLNIFSNIIENNLGVVLLVDDIERVSIYRGLNLVDYFIRPIDELRLNIRFNANKLIVKNQEKLFRDQSKQNKFIVKYMKDIIILNYDDIIYFEKERKKLHIHLENKIISLEGSFKSLIPKLPNEFIRVHNSYIINTEHIKEIAEYPNRTYEISFNNYNGVALMSRYKSQELLTRYCDTKKK